LYHHFVCTLCQRAICPPPLLPSLAAALEHSVRAHGVPWEYIPLSLSCPESDGEPSGQRCWSLPSKQMRSVEFHRPDFLYGRRVPPGHIDGFYSFFAQFASLLGCTQAYFALVDLYKRHRLLPLCGLLDEEHGQPALCFLSAEAGYEPPVAVQQQIWCVIHRFNGSFLPLSPDLFFTYVALLAREAEQAERDCPQAQWIEKDLRDGRTFVDIPTRQEVGNIIESFHSQMS
jgi:hypothetical protein